MHSIRLEIKDSVFDKVIYFLQNLPSDEVKIIDEIKSKNSENIELGLDVRAYSNHTANLIDEWKDEKEDEIWK